MSISLVCVLAMGASVAVTGCGVGPGATPADVSLANLQGSVHGGQQPVGNSNIYLYGTTSGGYGGAATLLGSVTTGPDGGFTIANATACSASQNVYIVAVGGNPGLAAGTNNKGLVLMAALGPCSSLYTTKYNFNVNINEVTTVAAAYALAGFLPAGGAGITYTSLTGGTAPGVGTSSTNTQGLNDAILNATNIVDFNAGMPRAVPQSNSAGTVPAATIFSLANILSSCVNTDGSTTMTVNGVVSNTNCGNLYAAATPPAGSGGVAPANTLQAILNIAAYPGNNVQALYNLQSAFPAFGGALTGVPNDWTVGVTYTATNLQNAAGLSIDRGDNVYTVGYPASSIAVLQFSPQGALLSPAAGWNSTATGGTSLKSTDNVREIKIDPSGNVYLADGAIASIYQYTPGGTLAAPAAGTFTGLAYTTAAATKNNWGLGIDTGGDIFTAGYKSTTCVTSPTTSSSYCGLIEFPASSLTTPTSTFGSSSALLAQAPSGTREIAIDSTNKLAYTGGNQGSVAYINNYNTGTQSTVTLASGTGNGCASPYGILLDGSSNAWYAGFGNATGTTTNCTVTDATPSQLYKVTASGAVTVIGASAPVPSTITSNGTPFSNAFYDAIDGNGNIFTTNSLINGTTAPASSTIAEYSPAFNSNAGAILSPNFGFAPGAASGSGLTGDTVVNGRSIAIDRSGAIWVLNPGAAGSLVQILGLAAPSNPVLSMGSFGVKP